MEYTCADNIITRNSYCWSSGAFSLGTGCGDTIQAQFPLFIPSIASVEKKTFFKPHKVSKFDFILRGGFYKRAGERKRFLFFAGRLLKLPKKRG